MSIYLLIFNQLNNILKTKLNTQDAKTNFTVLNTMIDYTRSRPIINRMRENGPFDYVEISVNGRKTKRYDIRLFLKLYYRAIMQTF